MDNPDVKIELDLNGEYPYIKKGFITSAYDKLQKDVWDIFSKNCTARWRRWFDEFRDKRGNKYSFSYSQIKKIMLPDDEKELQEFLAFLTHIGLINCPNQNVKYADRQYLLPILFRTPEKSY